MLPVTYGFACPGDTRWRNEVGSLLAPDDPCAPFTPPPALSLSRGSLSMLFEAEKARANTTCVDASHAERAQTPPTVADDRTSRARPTLRGVCAGITQPITIPRRGRPLRVPTACYNA